jgi:hypothetical protein
MQPEGACGVDDLPDKPEIGAAARGGVLGQQVGEPVEVGLGLPGRCCDDAERLGCS